MSLFLRFNVLTLFKIQKTWLFTFLLCCIRFLERCPHGLAYSNRILHADQTGWEEHFTGSTTRLPWKRGTVYRVDHSPALHERNSLQDRPRVCPGWEEHFTGSTTRLTWMIGTVYRVDHSSAWMRGTFYRIDHSSALDERNILPDRPLVCRGWEEQFTGSTTRLPWMRGTVYRIDHSPALNESNSLQGQPLVCPGWEEHFTVSTTRLPWPKFSWHECCCAMCLRYIVHLPVDIVSKFNCVSPACMAFVVIV